MSETAAEQPPRPVVPEDQGIAALRQLDIRKLPTGVSVRIDIKPVSTGRFRLRVDLGDDKARHEVGDRVMTFDDLVTDLFVFASENLTTAVTRQQAAGAGITL